MKRRNREGNGGGRTEWRGMEEWRGGRSGGGGRKRGTIRRHNKHQKSLSWLAADWAAVPYWIFSKSTWQICVLIDVIKTQKNLNIVTVEANNSTSAACISQPWPTEGTRVPGRLLFHWFLWVGQDPPFSRALYFLDVVWAVFWNWVFTPLPWRYTTKMTFGCLISPETDALFWFFLPSYYLDRSIKSINFKSRWLLNNISSNSAYSHYAFKSRFLEGESKH